jgi:hypothetical protein
MLLRTSIKKNLYYEIKDKIDEETFDGISIKKRPRKCKVYGCTSSKNKRNMLIELLHQRVQHHRDKFATKEIYDELCTMVVKPNGKTEHADDAHDDLVFSYLWALYVFYYGEDLATRFHIMKTEIYTDDHYDETSYSLEEEYGENDNVDPSIFRDSEDVVSKLVEDQMKLIKKSQTITFEDFYKKQIEEENNALNKIQQTPYGREAIANAYHMPIDYLEKQSSNGFVDISSDINKIMYGDEPKKKYKNPALSGSLADIFDKLS